MIRRGFLLEYFLIINVLLTREVFQFEEFILLNPYIQNSTLSDEIINLMVHK
jgi:hypothetical protein